MNTGDERTETNDGARPGRRPRAVTPPAATRTEKAGEAAAPATRDRARPRRPAALPVNAVREEADVFAPPAGEETDMTARAGEPRPPRGLPWGRLLLSAVAGLLLVRLVDAGWNWLRTVLEQPTPTGRLTLALAAIAVLAAVAILVRELAGLARLRRATRLHAAAESARATDDAGAARRVVARLVDLFARRDDLKWPRARLAETDHTHMTATETLALAERELLAPLDAAARAVIVAAARRTAVLTAMIPMPAIDMLLVAWQALRMVRRIAAVYGARPGFWGGLRLLRMALAHLAVAGALAFSDTLLQTLLGRGLAGRLSARFGEGAVNGLLAARLGLAAMELVRPLPYLALPAPSLAETARAAISPLAGGGD